MNPASFTVEERKLRPIVSSVLTFIFASVFYLVKTMRFFSDGFWLYTMLDIYKTCLIAQFFFTRFKFIHMRKHL